MHAAPGLWEHLAYGFQPGVVAFFPVVFLWGVLFRHLLVDISLVVVAVQVASAWPLVVLARFS